MLLLPSLLTSLLPFPHPFHSNRASSVTLIYVMLVLGMKLHFFILKQLLTLCCHLCKEFRTTRIHLNHVRRK